MMIFGDLTKKAEKQARELSSPDAGRKLNAIAALSGIAQEDLKPLKPAIPGLVAALGDPAPEVRVAALKLLNQLARPRAGARKDVVKGILDSLPAYGANLGEALAFLRRHAPGAKDAIEGNLPALVALLESESKAVRDGAAQVLEVVGVPANKYSAGMAESKMVLEEAGRCGAELEKADYMLKAARTGMKKGFYAEVDKNLELARELANNARKVAEVWRIKAPGVRAIDISNSGRFIAAGAGDHKLHVVDRTGAKLWSAAVPDGVTAVRISPDEGTIAACGGDGHLHCFNRKGEKLWSCRMGAPAASVGITDAGVTVACCGDNNIYDVGPGGNILSKHWTERSGWRLGISGDGEQIVVTYRDHNIYCYDRNLFLRWKFMGGIWNDVEISRDGETIIAGSQGSEVTLFSKIGMVVWKARTDEPVGNVAVSSGGDCVYFADPRNLYAYNRAGRPMMKYRTHEPVLAMATDSSGELLAVGFGDRFVLMRNREMVRQLVGQSGVMLENVQRLGVDVSMAAALLEKSAEAFASNDFETGANKAAEAWRLIEAAKSQRAEALVSSVQQVMQDARSLGGDISKSEALVKSAAESLRKGRLEGVLLNLGQAREEAEISRRVREEMAKAEKETKAQGARKAIQEAIASTDDAVEFGIESGSVEILLQKAIAAADAEEYDRAMLFLGQLSELVKEEKEKLPGRIEKGFRSAVALLARNELAPDDVELARGYLSAAIVYFEKAKEHRKLAEAYERLGFLEEKQGKIPYSKFLYQKAVNTYFKIGEIDQVLVLLVERMKRLEAITDKKVSEYTIEELFLIYRDGRLIHHNTRRLRPEVDNQVLGGMLIAIQHFVGDSFREKDAAKGEILNELRYGKTRILIEGGRWVHLALVISGEEPEDLRPRMRKVLTDIEEKYRSTLENWDGDTSKLWGTKKMVEPLITWL